MSPALEPGLPFGLWGLPLAPLALAGELFARSVARRHPGMFARLGLHAGKRFLIEPTDLPFVFVLVPRPDRPEFRLAPSVPSGDRIAADARVAGSLGSLLGLLHGAYDGDALFFSRDLLVEGDVEAVIALRNALDDAEIDLVAEGAAVLGPLAAPAEALGRLAAPVIERLTGLVVGRRGGFAP